MNNPSEIRSISIQEEETSVDLRQYLALILQWWWLIVLVVLAAGAAAYFLSQRMTPMYRSSTTLLINEAPSNRTTDYTSLITSERLAKTYAEMMVKRPVLEEVSTRLGIGYTPNELVGMITVTPVTDTQLLTITVESADMNLAPAVANALVVVFSEQLQETQSSRFAASKESLQKQIADSEAQIADAEARLSAIRSSDRLTAEGNNEIALLETRLNQYKQINANLVVSYENIRTTEAQSASKVEQIETAILNPNPVSPNVFQNTLLAAVVGLMLSVGGVFAYDMLDDRVKSPEDIRNKLHLPVMGIIPRFEEQEDGELITQAMPRSPITESFRSLRMNVLYASVDKPLRTLLVTSPTPSEGKTTVASNLAVVLSKTGKKVTIIDADLHRPRVHLLFNTNFQPGLSSMFLAMPLQLNDTFQETAVESLHVVSAGKLPPNPSELLGSKKMLDIINLVLEKSDMVIVDTPPILNVTDAMALAPSVDGVLLVVKPGITRISLLQTMVEQLNYVGAKVIGVVINGVDQRNVRYGYYYKRYHYRTYKQYEGEKEAEKGKAKAEKKAEKAPVQKPEVDH